MPGHEDLVLVVVVSLSIESKAMEDVLVVVVTV